MSVAFSSTILEQNTNPLKPSISCDEACTITVSARVEGRAAGTGTATLDEAGRVTVEIPLNVTRSGASPARAPSGSSSTSVGGRGRERHRAERPPVADADPAGGWTARTPGVDSIRWSSGPAGSAGSSTARRSICSGASGRRGRRAPCRTSSCCSSTRPSTRAGAAASRASCRWGRPGTSRRASTSSTSTAGGRSPTTAPASSSATRSWRSTTWSRTSARWRRR